MLKPNNTPDASQLPCWLAVVGDDSWGLDNSWGCLLRVLGGPSGASPGFLTIHPPLVHHQGSGGTLVDVQRSFALTKRCLYPVLPLLLLKRNASWQNDFHSFHGFRTSVIKQGFSPQSRRGDGDFSECTFSHVSLLLLHSKFPNLTTFMASCDSVYIINAWWWVIALSNWDRDAWFKYPRRILASCKVKDSCKLEQ